MKTIAVAFEKGGTGKSAVAGEPHEGYVRQGLRTSLCSLDNQYADTSGVRKAEDAAAAVVDTPGMLTDNLKDVVADANVAVVRVRPTPNDIESSMRAPFVRWPGGEPRAKNVVRYHSPRRSAQAQGIRKSNAAKAAHMMCAHVGTFAGLPYERTKLQKNTAKIDSLDTC